MAGVPTASYMVPLSALSPPSQHTITHHTSTVHQPHGQLSALQPVMCHPIPTYGQLLPVSYDRPSSVNSTSNQDPPTTPIHNVPANTMTAQSFGLYPNQFDTVNIMQPSYEQASHGNFPPSISLSQTSGAVPQYVANNAATAELVGRTRQHHAVLEGFPSLTDADMIMYVSQYMPEVLVDSGMKMMNDSFQYNPQPVNATEVAPRKVSSMLVCSGKIVPVMPVNPPVKPMGHSNSLVNTLVKADSNTSVATATAASNTVSNTRGSDGLALAAPVPETHSVPVRKPRVVHPKAGQPKPSKRAVAGGKRQLATATAMSATSTEDAATSSHQGVDKSKGKRAATSSSLSNDDDDDADKDDDDDVGDHGTSTAFWKVKRARKTGGGSKQAVAAAAGPRAPKTTVATSTYKGVTR